MNKSQDNVSAPECRSNHSLQLSSKNEHSGTESKFLNRGIRIANLYIRHLKPKLDEIKIMLRSSNGFFLGTCETFLNTTIPDGVLTVAGYTFERKDRSECDNTSTVNGGGILIHIEIV